MQESSSKPRSAGNFENDSQVQSSSMGSLEEAEEDDLFDEESIEISSFHSSLSKTLPEILADKSALGYFIQYMDSRGCVNLIKFWLEVECLSGACSETESLKNHNDHLNNMTSDFNSLSSTGNEDHFYCDAGVDSVENVNEELVLDKNVHNNDIKSNAGLPKNNLVITKNEIAGSICNFRNDGLRVSTVRQDALRIYKKYVAKDLLGPNLISDELKAEIEETVSCENAEPLLRCLAQAQKIIYKILENE